MNPDVTHLGQSERTETPQGLANKAVRRAFVRDALRRSGKQAVWAMGLAMIGVLVCRGFGWVDRDGGWWILVIIAGVWSIVVGMLLAWVNRMNVLEAAGLIDDRLGLESAIRSAIELKDDGPGDGFSDGLVTMAIGRGEVEASKADLDRVFDPIPMTQWYWSAGAVCASVIAGIWMPNMLGDQPPKLTVPSGAIAQLDLIEDVFGDDDQGEQTPEALSPAVQEAIDELEALKEELAGGVEDESDAQAQAAAKLEELADALDEDLDRQLNEEQALADKITQAQNQHLDEELDEGWDQIDGLAEAIKEQDYGQAQDQLDELMDRLEEMSDEQRQEISDAMDELAEGIDPESMDAQENETEPQGQDISEQLSDSLREQAEEIREGTKGPEEEPEEQPPEEKPEEQVDEQAEDQSSQDEQASGEDQRGDQPANEQAQEQEGKQSESESGSETSEQETRQETGDKGEQSQEQSQQEQQQEQSPKEGDASEKGERGEQESTGKQGQEQRSLQETLEEMQERQEQYQRQREQAQEIRERASELIDEGESGGYRESKNQGEEGKSFEPGEASELEGSGPMASKPEGDEPQDGSPNSDFESTFESVDATSKNPELNDLGEPIGEWYLPDEQSGEIDPNRSSATARRFRNATKKAQRAIEEQQVPRKYQRIVREAFERMNQRASEIEKSVESQSKIAPQGNDANAKKSSAKDTDQ